MVSVFSWEARRYSVASFTQHRTWHTVGQDRAGPNPSQHAITPLTALSTSRSLPHDYLHLCSPKLDIFGISTNSESLFLKCSLFSTEFFCLQHKSVCCVRPQQGSLCWLDMRRLLNRAKQGFSISTERNKYSHSVSQGPLTAYTMHSNLLGAQLYRCFVWKWSSK